MSEKLFTSNKKVIDFYKKNTSFDFDSVNLHVVHLLENIISDTENKLSSTAISQIYTMLNDYNSKLDSSFKNIEQFNKQCETSLTSLKQSIDSSKTDLMENIKVVRELVMTQKNDIENMVSSKLSAVKQSYIDEIRTLFNLQEQKSVNTINSSITNTINTSISHLIDNINKNITEIVPKLSEPLHFQLSNSLESFKNHITSESLKLYELIKTSSNGDVLNSFITNFNYRFTDLVKGINEPIIQYITCSEERIKSNISSSSESLYTTIDTIKTQVDNNYSVSDNTNKCLTDHLNKYKNSSAKGQISELDLMELLTKVYSDGEINNTTSQKKNADISLIRVNKPKIRFENKHYTTNVPESEVSKFVRDILHCNDSHGIFISQISGIANRQDWSIEMHDSHIILYLHDVNYDPEKIKMAVNIIDHIDGVINKYTKTLKNDTDNPIIFSQDEIVKIGLEIQNFISSKQKLIQHIEDSLNQSKKIINTIELPYLTTLVSAYTTIDNTSIFECETCGYKASNKRSLSMHISHNHKKSKPETRLNTPSSSSIYVEQPDTVSMNTSNQHKSNTEELETVSTVDSATNIGLEPTSTTGKEKKRSKRM
jgi:hypothetical protein